MEPGVVAVILVAVLVGVVAQTVAGFGFALIVVPVFVSVLDVKDGIVLATLLGVLNSGVLAVANRSRVPWPTVGPMLLGALAGMPLGLVVLLFAPANAIRALVGVATLIMSAALLRGLRFGDRSTLSELAVGGLSGALNTSTGANGPPVVLYLQGREHPPEEFRAALAVFFLACNVVTLAIFALSGIVSAEALALFGLSLPMVAAGNVLGRAAGQQLPERAFRGLVFGLLFASALFALSAAMAKLL